MQPSVTGNDRGPTASADRWPLGCAGVVALALVLRAGWALAVPVVPVADCYAYDLLARNMVAGHGYGFEPGNPSAFWPVGTAAAYAALASVFGPGYGPVLVWNVAVGLASVWMTMLLTRDWFGPKAGLAAGLLMAAWPGQVEFTTLLASEPMFNACVLLAVVAEGRSGWGPSGRVLLTGLALAAASYVRPVSLPLPLVLAWCRMVGPAAGSRGPRAVAAETAGVFLVMAVLIAPWTYRNARVLDEPVLISTNGGANLWMGNHPGADGAYKPLPEWVEGLDEVTRDDVLGAAAVKYIRENPGVFVAGFFRKLSLSHSGETIGVAWNLDGLTKAYGPGVLTPLKAVSSGYWWGALLLGLGGVVVALRGLGVRRASGLVPLVLWGTFAAVHAVIVGGDRYHYPSVPYIAAMGGLAVAAFLDRRKRD